MSSVTETIWREGAGTRSVKKRNPSIEQERGRLSESTGGKTNSGHGSDPSSKRSLRKTF